MNVVSVRRGELIWIIIIFLNTSPFLITVFISPNLYFPTPHPSLKHTSLSTTHRSLQHTLSCNYLFLQHSFPFKNRPFTTPLPAAPHLLTLKIPPYIIPLSAIRSQRPSSYNISSLYNIQCNTFLSITPAFLKVPFICTTPL